VAGDASQISSAESSAGFNLIPNIPDSQLQQTDTPLAHTSINRYRRLLQLHCMSLLVGQTSLNT